jgi:uroporphyrinogen decarboxylase
MKEHTPNYHHIVDAAFNRTPQRLPVYEHIIAPEKMEEILGRKFVALYQGDADDQREFFREFNGFFKRMGYDTVSFEGCVVDVVAQGQALSGHTPGAISTREDFEKYPFDELPGRYWVLHDRHFQLLGEEMPVGMKAIGGIGNGVFEIAQDLAGYTGLCMMRVDDPQLYADLFAKVGDLMVALWKQLLERHGNTYAVCRFGDDLGFKSSTLLSPSDIRTHILPQYKRIVDIVHAAGKPFLLHSCGCIFEVMEDIVKFVGIDAKHSNEDQIAPFRVWVERYGSRIGNFGGVDMDVLCRQGESEIKKYVSNVIHDSVGHGGIAIGSGNSIPDYVPAAGYLAMLETVWEYRSSAEP